LDEVDEDGRDEIPDDDRTALAAAAAGTRRRSSRRTAGRSAIEKRSASEIGTKTPRPK
jgi:hypothetical protein